MLKVKSLLQPICGMLPTDASLRQAIERVAQGEMKLPAGCEITYDLEAIDILDRLLKRDGQDAIDLWVSDFVEQQGTRPQLSELQNAGLNPRALFTKYGSWFGYLEYRHAQQPVYLSGQDVRLIEQYRAWWQELCITKLTKSFKMLVLLGMQHQNAWSRKMSWEELALEFQRLAPRWKGVREEITVDIDNVKTLARYVRDNPGKAWGGGSYFLSNREGLQLKLAVADEEAEAFGEMVREVAEWRLRDHFERGWRSQAEARGEYV